MRDGRQESLLMCEVVARIHHLMLIQTVSERGGEIQHPLVVDQERVLTHPDGYCEDAAQPETYLVTRRSSGSQSLT